MSPNDDTQSGHVKFLTTVAFGAATGRGDIGLLLPVGTAAAADLRERVTVEGLCGGEVDVDAGVEGRLGAEDFLLVAAEFARALKNTPRTESRIDILRSASPPRGSRIRDI